MTRNKNKLFNDNFIVFETPKEIKNLTNLSKRKQITGSSLWKKHDSAPDLEDSEVHENMVDKEIRYYLTELLSFRNFGTNFQGINFENVVYFFQENTKFFIFHHI